MSVLECNAEPAGRLRSNEFAGKGSELRAPTGPRIIAVWSAVAVFAICVGSTFISYQPYVFLRWDDADYLWRAVAVNRALWSRDVHGLGAAMVSIRPPAMTLLGVAWGPLNSWNDVGKCFISLGTAISLLASFCLYLLLRIGMKPGYLIGASACVALSIGPILPGSTVHSDATSFMADNFFAWTTLAALLLVPFEANSSATIAKSALHGGLWGAILSIGTMTKLNFLYFAVLIVPVLHFLELRRNGLLHAVTSFSSFACCSLPAAIYLFRYGKVAVENARASSFGSVSELYYRPLLSFFRLTIQDAPGTGVSCLLIFAGVMYWCLQKRIRTVKPELIAILVVTCFLVMVLAAPNRQIRYAFPVIVALPFLVGVLLSEQRTVVAPRSAALAAAAVLCGLVVASVPMRHRPDLRSLTRSSSVLAAADVSKARNIVLATDSPTLNISLLRLASEFSGPGPSIDTVAYQSMHGAAIQDDFRILEDANFVVFQDARHTSPKYTNQRVPEYQDFVRQKGCTPFTVGDDINIYPIHCSH